MQKTIVKPGLSKIVLPGDFTVDELSRAVENATQAAILQMVDPHQDEMGVFGTLTFKRPRYREGEVWKVMAKIGKRYGVSRALYVAEHHADPKRGLHAHIVAGFKDRREIPQYLEAMESFGKSELVPVISWDRVTRYITKHVGKGECGLNYYPRAGSW